MGSEQERFGTERKAEKQSTREGERLQLGLRAKIKKKDKQWQVSLEKDLEAGESRTGHDTATLEGTLTVISQDL